MNGCARRRSGGTRSAAGARADAGLSDRRALLLLAVAVAAIVAAKLVFHLRVAVLGVKYLVFVAVVVAVVALLAGRGDDRRR